MSKTAVQTKPFDAVQAMREIREKLSQRYWQHTEVLKSDLEKTIEEANKVWDERGYTNELMEEWRQTKRSELKK